MIKINLLPIKAARKREYVKQQLILFIVLVVGAVIGLYLWWSWMDGKVTEKQKQITQAEQQIEQYKKAIGEVDKYKGLEEALNLKLKIIEDLIKGKSGPVRIMDRLSHAIPKQVWLTSWTENNGNVTIEGEALSNKQVGNFMSSLGAPIETTAKKTDTLEGKDKKKAAIQKSYFTNIRLVETEMKEDSKFQLVFVTFTILLKVNYAI
ncbi:MAG: PilN domain-containing protein [Deltaproteobacteria bacterium]|nr:PilN domain-containing protein [Deltaproteobacteria bacterium]